MTIDEYIKELTIDTKIQLHKDYIQFEKEGSTGDTLLRKVVEEYMKQKYIEEHWFHMVSKSIMFDIYKELFERFVRQHYKVEEV